MPISNVQALNLKWKMKDCVETKPVRKKDVHPQMAGNL